MQRARADKIRVLHLIEDLGAGGAERLLYVNLSRLDRSRFEGVVCHLYDRALHWRQPILDLGYPVVSLGLRSIYGSGLGVLRLLRLLGRERIDIVHTHLYRANVIARVEARIGQAPLVNSLHNPDYDLAALRDNPALSPAKLRALRFVDRFTCRIGRPEFVAVSEHVRDAAVRDLRIPRARTEVIYNAIDLAAFRPMEGATAQLRADLGFGERDLVLVCVARFDPQKGQRYLVQALPALLPEFPRVKVAFIGGGSSVTRDAVARLARELGVEPHVIFAGVQSDVRAYLQICDVFVLPSLYEGMGIALVEAMAMERPCVACRTTAVPEVVADGRSGLLVPPADVAALVDAIRTLLRDPVRRRCMGAEGRRIAERRFDSAVAVRQLEAVYERLAGPPHATS
jgi:glycosyltransferase involved in cell wall biosynthesis